MIAIPAADDCGPLYLSVLPFRFRRAIEGFHLFLILEVIAHHTRAGRAAFRLSQPPAIMASPPAR
ncbi:hypothetical protein MPC1_13570002 [Methylocella tundrae]|nr:hypothetical protein MPC1_13570002 [Methylocella tundrae]